MKLTATTASAAGAAGVGLLLAQDWGSLLLGSILGAGVAGVAAVTNRSKNKTGVKY